MGKRKGYCPVCMFETIIETGKTAYDYYCPRHNIQCIYSGEKTPLKWEG